MNTPIENYVQMEAIFGGSQATGRFAMVSNEPLGTPIDLGQGDDGVEDLTELGATEANSRKRVDQSWCGEL